MGQIANSMGGEEFTGEANGALELRVFRVMIASVSVAVIASTFLAPWRVTSGLMLGAMLSLLNYHWLQSSIAAIFNDNGDQRPRVRIFSYIIRYFVVAGAAFAAYKLGIVSLPATIAGLCSIVPAIFVEAGRQFYLSMIRREESY